MHITCGDFEQWDNKAITLLGMSGVGKTTLANKLPKSAWFHYSGDYRIGTKYLQEAILDNVKKEAMKVDFLRDLLCSDSIYIGSNITVHNLEPISTFLGKIGNPELGGLSLEEFRARQRLHREAEIHAMRDVASFITKAKDIYRYAHFINDMGGSVCELDDDDVLETLAEHTLIIYIRAGKDTEDKLITRQIENSKPLYYHEDFFEGQLTEYLRQEGLKEIKDIDPDGFMQWIFPKLVAHRRPLYQAIADQYGYTVEARDAEKAQNEADFIKLICETLQKQAAA
ncbi:MAG: ATPase [Proteobacteria bacterium]|nr:MAG: ATPase [Pseudomonadota bacterium]TDJ68438.1 MAG: ATPase [Pseudomonadota bacterium]